MRKFTFLIFVFYVSILNAQKLSFETLLNDEISIRAIQVDKDKVWYAGSKSKLGYVNLENSLDKKQIILSDKKLEFRTLAQDKNAFYAINIESPANFYKVDKNTLKSKIIFTDTVKTAFYDALHFANNNFYTFSDPKKDLDLRFLKFTSKKNLFKFSFYDDIKLNEGEAAFAASNSNIASSKKHLWIATGGKSSRIIRMDFKTQKFKVFETPFVQGESSQGIYSIDFYNDDFGIAVGGDYTQQQANINNIAITNDGGKTWIIQASGKNAGYKTCVKIRPNFKGKHIIAIGDQNIEFSSDFGKTWTKISDEKGLFVCTWIDENTVVFAGKNRILKAKFIF